MAPSSACPEIRPGQRRAVMERVASRNLHLRQKKDKRSGVSVD
jgi:hypothetical protein